LAGVDTVRFYEEQVLILVREAYDLVLDRRAVPWPATVDVTPVHSGLLEVGQYQLVCGRRRPRQPRRCARHPRAGNTTERPGRVIGRDLVERSEVDGISPNTRRRTCLQPQQRMASLDQAA